VLAVVKLLKLTIILKIVLIKISLYAWVKMKWYSSDVIHSYYWIGFFCEHDIDMAVFIWEFFNAVCILLKLCGCDCLITAAMFSLLIYITISK
jgi:hypothetical protein